jgi:hypothetical protein
VDRATGTRGRGGGRGGPSLNSPGEVLVGRSWGRAGPRPSVQPTVSIRPSLDSDLLGPGLRAFALVPGLKMDLPPPPPSSPRALVAQRMASRPTRNDTMHGGESCVDRPDPSVSPSGAHDILRYAHHHFVCLDLLCAVLDSLLPRGGPFLLLAALRRRGFEPA